MLRIALYAASLGGLGCTIGLLTLVYLSALSPLGKAVVTVASVAAVAFTVLTIDIHEADELDRKLRLRRWAMLCWAAVAGAIVLLIVAGRLQLLRG